MPTSATIIADSVNKAGVRITTFQVEAPRFLLAEINTHRVIARSAASSRAIPVKRRVEMVREDPFMPTSFGKNQKGMRADVDLTDYANALAQDVWMKACSGAIECALLFDDLGVHKQHANRILEPYTYYYGVMTATEWDNFYKLRLHPDAQPEFKVLAELMQEAYYGSSIKETDHHLPYTDDVDPDTPLETLRNISAARCARSSYKTFDGVTSKTVDDIRLCADLINGGHLSPFDHVATSDTFVHRFVDRPGFQGTGWFWENPDDHRHLYGWVPYRVQIEEEQGWECRRNSYKPFALTKPLT